MDSCCFNLGIVLQCAEVERILGILQCNLTEGLVEGEDAVTRTRMIPRSEKLFRPSQAFRHNRGKGLFPLARNSLQTVFLSAISSNSFCRKGTFAGVSEKRMRNP